MQFTVTIDEKYRITLPKPIIDALGIKLGDKLILTPIDNNTAIITKKLK